MSKAFTRESDESGAEEIPPFRHRLPPGASNYTGREGADRQLFRPSRHQPDPVVASGGR